MKPFSVGEMYVPLVLPQKRMLVLRARDKAKLTSVFPNHRDLSVGPDHHIVGVPHTLDTDKVLENMGVPSTWPSPYRTYYEPPLIRGRYTPRDDQHAVAEFICRERRCFVLNPPRLGKTASALMACDYIRKERKYTKGRGATLVVAPLPTLGDVWVKECFGLRPDLSVVKLTGDRKRRLRLLAEDHDMYVINPDGVKVISAELLAAVKDGRIKILIVDEITEYKNPNIPKFKALFPIAQAVEWAVGMTGTPGGPEDVYGIVKLIRPDNVPKSRNMWLSQTMLQVGPQAAYKFVPRFTAKDDIKKALTPSIRFEKSILGLARLLKIDRRAEMSDMQRAAYTAVLRDAMLQTEDGSQTVSAVNAGVLTSKLIQIACGAVKDDEGNVIHLDMTPRLEMLDIEIAKSESKVVIFTPFRATIAILEKHLSYCGCVRIDGDVTGKKRDAELDRWRLEEGPKVAVLHPRTGAFGLELAQADTLIFFGPPLNGDIIYSQAGERINSPLQKSLTPTIVRLSASLAEDKIFGSLERGVDWMKEVTDLFSEILKEEG